MTGITPNPDGYHLLWDDDQQLLALLLLNVYLVKEIKATILLGDLERLIEKSITCHPR
jgi:hypothetical protein